MGDVIETVQRVTTRELNIDRKQPQKGDMKDTYADTSLAKQDLGYSPLTALEQGISEEWAWIQSHYG